MTMCIFTGCLSVSAPCENTIKDQVRSPNGNFIAIGIERNCGATTTYSSLVQVLPSATSLTDENTIFIVKGEPDIQLLWENNSTLNIACNNCEKESIFMQKRSLHVISINY
jgi:hypothetical protein